MKKQFKKLLAAVLALATMLTCVSCIAYADNGKNEYYPTILVPGLFQSEIKLYNEDGTIKLDDNGKEYQAPFFIDLKDIILDGVFKGLLPLLRLLITQNDKDDACKQAVTEILCNAFKMNLSDYNGDFIYNVQPVRYTTSLAKCSDHDRETILKTVPIQKYVDIAGADHVYYLSYNSFGNNLDIAEELYNLILQVREETGYDKVNLVSISMGGTYTNTLLEVYNKDGYNVNSMLNRIVYVIPALNGSRLISDLFVYGFIDDDDAIYDYMFPNLVDDPQWLGYLLNFIIRILPKDEVNGILDYVVDGLIEGFLQNSTAIWGLVPYEQYDAAAEKFLSDPEDAEIRRQTDIYHEAQGNRFVNIQKAIDAGVEVFDICNYNYGFYPITDAYNEVNGDGIIQIESTSMGATSFGHNVQLPEGYTPDPDKCHCSEHNHIDPYNILDASTGYLPDQTWYFYGQNHESTGSNDIIMSLAVELLIDNDFDSVFDRPEEYPQFNSTRDSKWVLRSIEATKKWDLSTVSEEDVAELEAAIKGVEDTLESTVADVPAFNAASERFYAIYDKINYQLMDDEGRKNFDKQKRTEKIENFVTDLLKKGSEFLNEKIGYQGYSDYINSLFFWNK